MKVIFTTIVLLSFVAIVFSQGGYTINRYAISSGGTQQATNGTDTLYATLGQPFIGEASNSQYQLASGFWPYVSVIVGLEDQTDLLLPKVYDLGQNFPNPFNPITKIKYALPHMSTVRLDVFNVLGAKVNTLVDEEQNPGYHLIQWDGRNTFGQSVSSGVYFYRIIAISKKGKVFAKTMKMIFIK